MRKLSSYHSCRLDGAELGVCAEKKMSLGSCGSAVDVQEDIKTKLLGCWQVRWAQKSPVQISTKL